jgi:predicted enzyme related to lactoylglutathione lyase
MSNADPRGKFVWHELLTADSAAATAFYTKVVGWKTQPWEADSSYSMWVAKNGPVGGIGALADSAPSHWLSYIGVADVAATVEAAKGLGGRVVNEPADLPGGGRYAVLEDPQGAKFGVHQAGTAMGEAPPPGVGEFTWHELATSDAKAAMGFYTKLFGWEVGPVHNMGPAGDYHLFLRNGEQYGGIYVSEDPAPNWLVYIGVEDAGKAAALVKSAGGRVVNGPIEVPGGSWVAQALDPDGAPFAVHEPKVEQGQKAAEKPAAKPAKAKASKAAAVAESSITKPPQPESSITKPPQPESVGGAASSITKPPQTASVGGAASSITKPPRVRSTGGAASSITKPPQADSSRGGAASSITKPPAAASLSEAPKKSAAKKGKKKAAPAKKAAAKKAPAKKAPAKKAAAKKTPGKKAAKKSAAKGKAKPARKAAKKAPAKKAAKKSAAKRAPAKKKAKAKKHR